MEIQLSENKVDLYDRPREQDTSDVSEIVLEMLTIYNKSMKRDFEEEDIDGGVQELHVENEEEMLVSLCYAAERITYGAKSSLDTTDIEF